MKPKYFYHSTSYSNLISILSTRTLQPNIGHKIAGSTSDNFVSLSDTLHHYLGVMFGNYIIQFYASTLLKSNVIKPRIYQCNSIEEFEEMPFEEAEWVSPKINFEDHCIKKIICLEKDIEIDIEPYGIMFMDVEELPKLSLNFMKKRYKKRIINEK